jgi:hypothetical protein
MNNMSLAWWQIPVPDLGRLRHQDLEIYVDKDENLD